MVRNRLETTKFRRNTYNNIFLTDYSEYLYTYNNNFQTDTKQFISENKFYT